MAEERSPCPVKVVYFDCPSGAAGDMIMASLLDAETWPGKNEGSEWAVSTK